MNLVLSHPPYAFPKCELRHDQSDNFRVLSEGLSAGDLHAAPNTAGPQQTLDKGGIEHPYCIISPAFQAYTTPGSTCPGLMGHVS